LVGVLRNCLSPQETRYQSCGELRRELGKILFSGPYSPSTFNLAFLLNSLFATEIEAESRDRARELAIDADALEQSDGRPPLETPGVMAHAEPKSDSHERRATGLVGAILVAAALAGTIYLVWRRPASPNSSAQPPRAALTAPVIATAPPTPAAAITPVSPES